MTTGVIDFSNAGKINEVARRRIRKGVGAPGDAILSHKGTVGRVAVAPAHSPEFVCSPQTTFWRSLRPDHLDQRYLRYVLQSADFQRQLSVLGGQTDMAPYVSLSDQRAMQIDVPPIVQQRAIAEVLGALDDKIAANDRIRKVTDQLCTANFRRLADNRDWTNLSTIAVVNAVAIRPSANGTVRYVDISSVDKGTYAFPPPTSWAEAPGRARRVVRRGDTIWSTVRPNRRSHALVLDSDPSLVASTGLAVLTPLSGRVAGLYEATRMEAFSEYLESVAEGSAYPAVRADRFGRAPVPALDGQQWEAFENFALPLRERAHAAEVESRALRATRDELLPLLMSGKVRVRDAERAVGEVL
jgi:type I restriction enzyme S subunit